jgi:flagellar basal body rod protein FlgG
MAKTQAKSAEGEDQAPAADPMVSMLGELTRTMKSIQTQNDNRLALPAEGLFEAKVPKGVYRVGDRLVNCEGEPVTEDGEPAKPEE